MLKVWQQPQQTWCLPLCTWTTEREGESCLRDEGIKKKYVKGKCYWTISKQLDVPVSKAAHVQTVKVNNLNLWSQEKKRSEIEKKYVTICSQSAKNNFQNQ